MSTGERRRHASLDGLRGLAALVVVLGHIGLVRPMVDDGPGSSQWWFDRTPLHLLRGGGEAVFVFFVLSGFVLTLPLLRGESPRWRSYYPRRLARLYLPVWASLGLALLLWWLVGDAAPGASLFVRAAALPVTPQSLLGDVTLANTSTLNGVLWSLRWEVVFSLLLPLYWRTAVAMRRFGVAGFALPVAVIVLGVAGGSAAVTYLPMFLLGSLLAVHRHDLTRTVGGWSPQRATVIAAAAVLLLSAGITGLSLPIMFGLIAIGATLTVALFLTWPPAVAFGSRRGSQWIGRRSFSLYLVHTPVVIAVNAALPGLPGIGLLLVGLPASLALAAAFYRFVEKPSMLIAARLAAKQPLVTPRASSQILT